MHELGIMSGVLDAATQAARDAGAERLLGVTLRIGDMTEAIEDALVFAWDALIADDPFTADAKLDIVMVHPKSRCLECGAVYEHDRFSMFCPECDSFATELIAGREKQIDSIEVDMPDDGADAADGDAEGAESSCR